MDYLSSLNEEQQKAVTFSEKHALVIAGAGTGKTRTIIHKQCIIILLKYLWIIFDNMRTP